MKRHVKVIVAGLGLAAVLAVSLATPLVALAASTAPKPIYTQVVIPGSPVEATAEGIRGKVTDLAQYIGFLYSFLLGIIGVVAGVAIMVGGFTYLTAGGDKSKVEEGKKRIYNALAGMVIAFTAYLLLNTINPDLVKLKVPTIDSIQPEQALVAWCETLETSGTKVDPVQTQQDAVLQKRCGSLGSYAMGDATGYCVYYGGTPGTFKPDTTTNLGSVANQGLCFQANNLSSGLKALGDEMKKTGAKPEGKILAVNLACASLSKKSNIDSLVSALGYPIVTSGICDKWNATANQDKSKTDNFMSCVWSSDDQGCVFTPIGCSYIGGDCTNYDVIQSYVYQSGPAGDQQVKNNNVEKFDATFKAICGWNPCKANQPAGCDAGGTIGNDCLPHEAK
jgi:hypothetical protein